MKILTLKYDYWLNSDLDKYLLQINGIEKVAIDLENDEIYVKYNSKIINIVILLKEINLYLELDKIPSIISFDKHNKYGLEDEIIIKDLCCEYCLKSNIEELLFTDGIDCVTTDFDFFNKKNVKIKIKYNQNIITKQDIIKLGNKFNLY